MKKRILSLVLCAAMLLSMCLFLGAGVTNSLTVCDSSGEAVKRVDLPVNQKISLTAQAQSAAENDAYQWQIQAAKNVWANILGSDTQTLELSYPMVASALSEKNTVQIRCRLTSAETGEATFSDAVTIEVTAATAVDTPASADAAAAPVLRSPAKVAAAANDAYGTYTIIIKYQFADGRQAANPWSATVADGTTYTQDVTSPAVVGYTPDPSVVHVDSSNAKEYIVTYQPAEVKFTVEHYQQNVDDDNYTLANTEIKNGYTESPVGANLATTYEGFYSLLYDTTTKIAADGSTVVKIYYDRYYFLMNFDLDGGYGVEPIYARYDAPISVGDPTKPGYTFNVWEPELPAKMPAENTTHKATWNTSTTSYTVVYWYENANDDGYSYVADQTITDVAPGISVSSDAYRDADFNNKDAKHFTYNKDKIDNVTVAGDGSTILNVYFTRNTYTLTFKEGGAKVLSCGKVEHEHTPELCCNSKHSIMGHHTGYGFGGTCNTNKCPVGYEHTHSDSCYKASDLTITAKYQKDIHDNFPIKDGDETIWWIVPDKTETYGELDEQTYLGSIDTMPGENITFKKKDAESGAKIYYYVETLNGTSGDTTYNGKNYTQYKVIDLDYSSSTSLTYKEEFHPITGFTQGDSNPTLPKDGSVKMKQNNYLYYTRNSYNLKFYNYNAPVDGRDAIVQYEAPLSGYNFTPAYPANLEEHAYEFAGWYTTTGCYAGSEVNWTTAKMPASDVTLYAKWVPVTHTVKTYKTENDLNTVGPALGAWTVSHGKTVENPPANPTNAPYTFVGWFYKDADGTEHAFDFSMPVNRDLNLYAKWIVNTLMEYTIRYQLEDGTSIADDTKGSALAGSTKTFEAKTGDQLNDGYQSGYFPTTSSHSITMDIDDPAKNEYTFVYVPKAEVEYTVKYLEKGTERQLEKPKIVKTREAVVTETFKQISGYAPDAYQKRLVLAAENNEIIFWYVKDDTHAPVQIIHWTQNIAGGGYTEYQSSTNLNGVIGNTYTETPLTIAGFTYNAKPDHPVDGYPAKASGELTASGLVLNLYYDRIKYPYEFRFVDMDTNQPVADSVSGRARYQAQVTRQAKTIPGYELVSGGNSQSMVIQIEDPDDVASKNVKTFYYREQTVDIKYVAVGSGTLDNVQDSNVKVLTGSVNGSTPTPNAGYKFVGWFEDEACTQAVNKAWVNTGTNKLTPQKSVPYGNQEGYGAATYYAKFERDVFNLTIEKKVANGSKIDQNQTFVFRVQGKGVDMQVVITGEAQQTIKNLPVGDYTITEDTNWSWKYTPVGNAEKRLTTSDIEKGAATVTFENKNNGTNWLTSLAKAINTWAGGNANEKTN